MTRKYFGTDGIRGRTNTSKLTPEIAMKAGMAAGRIFTRGDHRHRVVIGKDTRLSGYMIESALVSGFTAVGMDVFQFGPLPTPAVAMLTRSLARRSRRDDHRLAQSVSTTTASNSSAPTARNCPTRWRLEIEALMDAGLEAGPGHRRQHRPRQAHRRQPGALYRIRQAHLPAQSAAGRLAHRDRLRQWRRLQGGAGSVVGIGRRHRHHGRDAGRHSTSIWIAARPRPRPCAPRCAKCAPISASRWTAMPTGW